MKSPAETVAAALAVPASAVHELHPGELVLEATAAALPELSDRAAVGLNGRLSSLFASDERGSSNRFLLHHVWSLKGLASFLRIVTPLEPAQPFYPSIAAKYPAANWFEREVMDFFGLRPEGHPNPSRVALHDDWPEGVHALRKDFPSERTVSRVQGEFHPVPSGDG